MGERTPRPICETELELVALFDAENPPLALAQGEIAWITGGLFEDIPWGGFQPWKGFRSYRPYSHLEIEVGGRKLRYEYEGDRAYALVEDSNG